MVKLKYSQARTKNLTNGQTPFTQNSSQNCQINVWVNQKKFGT